MNVFAWGSEMIRITKASERVLLCVVAFFGFHLCDYDGNITPAVRAAAKKPKANKPETPPLPTQKQIQNFRIEWTDPATRKQIQLMTKYQLVNDGVGPDRVKWPGFHKQWLKSQAAGHRWIRLLAHLNFPPEDPTKKITRKDIAREGNPIYYHVLDPDGRLMHSVTMRKVDACYH